MSEQPCVRTVEGLVEGRRRQEHAVFRGIPYARPPVGALRFAAPVPLRPWEGKRQAAEFGPPPPQSVPHAGPPAGSPAAGTDWLTLNVCTPDPGAAGLPVLVWIPGGAYVAADSSDAMYDPAALAAAGLVAVSVNYRVGAEGFALLDGAPPNRGFLDQIAALEWVRRNIAAFGGDPGRVTVAGQSAGAGSIAALLTMEPARGLFRRAITHSVPGWYCTRALAEQVAGALAERLGAAPTAAALSGVDPWRLAGELTALGAELPGRHESWGRLARAGIAVFPVVDGEVLSETPWPALAGGRAGGTELLVGHTRDEFRLFSVMTGRLGTFTDADARTALELFAPAPDGAAAYRAAHPGASAEELLETVYSDALFRMPSLRLAEANAAAGGTSFLFELRLNSPAMGGVLGACHSLDVPLAFGTLDSPTGRGLVGDLPTPGTLAVSRELQRAWIRFATTGAPGWAAHRPGERLTRVLEDEPRTMPYPEEASRRIWEGRAPAPFDLV
ncbi:carboxylesterase [Streptomyces eurocidicus]|uniref:Carboxylic ester hydrolase n=1 Tax=Streptomyces eurocidicus TaxID=66423 RepID=A0A2N8NVL0_STREU|nr:carboxylesterase family protein [Streptomyces eurocidicus]MBB5122307.1 para-nitrobenzyl esterase [Streptomyces eurocidicus]MBF6055187.1 carboxylesterase family protein [Streptomyces eurocidicus]PNE32820.1 carboxylesterase [Streptomyces eurocidicus]